MMTVFAAGTVSATGAAGDVGAAGVADDAGVTTNEAGSASAGVMLVEEDEVASDVVSPAFGGGRFPA